MTPTELKALMRTAKYEVTATGEIRTPLGNDPLGVACCSAVGYWVSRNPTPHTGSAADWLDISPVATRRMADAADNPRSPWRPLLLQWLHGRIV